MVTLSDAFVSLLLVVSLVSVRDAKVYRLICEADVPKKDVLDGNEYRDETHKHPGFRVWVVR